MFNYYITLCIFLLFASGAKAQAVYEDERMPEQIKVESIELCKGTKLKMLGASKRLKWKKADTGFVVSIPEEIRNNPPCEHAWVIKANKVTC